MLCPSAEAAETVLQNLREWTTLAGLSLLLRSQEWWIWGNPRPTSTSWGFGSGAARPAGAFDSLRSPFGQPLAVYPRCPPVAGSFVRKAILIRLVVIYRNSCTIARGFDQDKPLLQR